MAFKFLSLMQIGSEQRSPIHSGSAEPEKAEHMDVRMLVLMRCLLSFLAIIWIDLEESKRWVELTYVSLSAYLLYSGVLAWRSFQSRWAAPGRLVHWADIAFYTYLVALTAGTSSIFFFFFFYAILTASFSHGFREGVQVTLASVALSTVVGFMFSPGGSDFDLDRALIQPIYMLALGYMLAHWGGFEIQLKRKLGLLRDISSINDARFGVDHVIGINLERLQNFYSATSCLLVLKKHGTPPVYYLYSASRIKTGNAMIPISLTESAARELMPFRPEYGTAYHDPAGSWRRLLQGHIAYAGGQNGHHDEQAGKCYALANMLDARVFMTAPYLQPDGSTGRIYLTADDITFTHLDLDFLVQAAEALAVVVVNVSLMEDLITKAAGHERRRISRDIHDSTLQPYIGLRLALYALLRDVHSDDRLAARVNDLIELTSATIRNLRGYAENLREQKTVPGSYLIVAVNKEVENFRRYHGLVVELVTDVSVHLSGKIAAEAYQMISEALSNVLKHASGKKAFVRILCVDAILLLEIGNELATEGKGAVIFTPRTISERAQAIGGKVYVELDVNGYTVVRISIPLEGTSKNSEFAQMQGAEKILQRRI